MTQLLAPDKFSATTARPQVQEPVPSQGFNAMESIKYGFKAMYSKERFLPWLVFSFMALIIHLPALILLIPFLSSGVNASPDASDAAVALTGSPSVLAWAGYVAALVWSVYVQACVIRGIIEGVRTGKPQLRGLAMPLGLPTARIYGFTFIETAIGVVAVFPALMLTLMAATQESIALMIVAPLISGVLSFVASLFLMFGRQVIIDSGKGVFASVAYSARLVKENFGQSLLLVIVTGVIAFVATVALVIPLFFVLAPMNIAMVHAYRRAGFGEIYPVDGPAAES